MEEESIHMSHGLMESDAEVKRQNQLDFFAGCALTGLIAGALGMGLAGSSGGVMSVDVDWAYVCKKSYSVARQMIEQGAAEKE